VGRRDDRQEQGPSVENFRLPCHDVSSESLALRATELLILRRAVATVARSPL